MSATYIPHPGEILKTEFLDELGLSNYALAQKTGIPESSVGKIVRGTMKITARTAIQLSTFFGNSPQFWLNLQSSFDLRQAELAEGDELRKRVKPIAS